MCGPQLKIRLVVDVDEGLALQMHVLGAVRRMMLGFWHRVDQLSRRREYVSLFRQLLSIPGFVALVVPPIAL